jgi:hypothetical protein
MLACILVGVDPACDQVVFRDAEQLRELLSLSGGIRA